MRVAIVVSAVPHYYAARLRALGAVENAVFVINAGGGNGFYASIRSRELHDIQVLDLPQSAPHEVYRQTITLLEQNEPDAVAITGWATAESFAAIAWARRNGKRIVVMSDSQAIDAVRSPLREAIKSRVVRACDAALVAGHRSKDYVVSLGMAEDRVFLGYDAVDNTHFAQGAKQVRADAAATRRRLGLPHRYLLASARFIPKKNLPRLIEAYAKAIMGLGDAPDLLILGDGPERDAVEAAIARADIVERVHLPGFRDYELLPAFYSLAEGFVHASTTEQWGLVINEAAAAGLPLVVSTPCGAAIELLREGENGFLVDPAETEDIARALRKLMTLPDEARTRMGEASRSIVAEWGPDRFAEGFMAACAAALAQPARKLAPWDKLLIRALARREIEDVA